MAHLAVQIAAPRAVRHWKSSAFLCLFVFLVPALVFEPLAQFGPRIEIDSWILGPALAACLFVMYLLLIAYALSAWRNMVAVAGSGSRGDFQFTET